jgi:hypothetical protein
MPLKKLVNITLLLLFVSQQSAYAISCLSKIENVHLKIEDTLSSDTKNIVTEALEDVSNYNLISNFERCVIDYDETDNFRQRLRMFSPELNLKITSIDSMLETVNLLINNRTHIISPYSINIFVRPDSNSQYSKLLFAQVSESQPSPFMSIRYTHENTYQDKQHIVIIISYLTKSSKMADVISFSYKFIGP